VADQPHDLQELARADGRGLKRRLAKGFGTLLVTVGTMVASRILLVPLYLMAWGVGTYADWLVLQATAMLLQCTLLGQHWRYARKIRDAWAVRDIAKMNHWLQASLGYWILIYAVVGLALALFVTTVDITRIFALGSLGRVEAGITLLLLTAANLALICQESLRSLYQSRGQFARAEMIVTTNLFLQTALVASFLLLDASVVVIATIQCATSLGLATAMLILDSRHRFPEVCYRLSLRRADLPRRGDLYDLGLPHLAETMSLSGPMFLLGLAHVPSQQIVQFGLARTLGQTMRLLAKPFANMFTVELVRQQTQGDRSGMRRLYRFAAVILALVVGGIAGAFLAAADLIFALWTNNKVQVDIVLFAMVMMHESVINLGYLTISFMRLGGFARDLVLPSVIDAVAYMSIALGAAFAFGAYGLGAAIILLDLMLIFLVPAILVRRRTGLPVTSLIGLPLLVMATIGALAYGAMSVARGLLQL
jgi:O-antigen/teichoic acid export membrane protein